MVRRLVAFVLFATLALLVGTPSAATPPALKPGITVAADAQEPLFPSPLPARKTTHRWPSHRSTSIQGAKNGPSGPIGSYGNAAIDAMIASVFTTGTATALRVADCESHDQPLAKNPDSSAAGVFQILGGPTDALANIRLAWSMSDHGTNWTPWFASKACWG